ncbi:Hpt domain-containing protein [Sinomonas sp. RB5]
MSLPVIDPTVLGRLAAEIGDAGAARFARGVVRLWPQRRERLAAALAVGSAADSLDAALSLRTAASMAGALRLADAADRIVACVRAEGPRAAMALLPRALACGDVTIAVLARGLPADLAGAATAAVFSRSPAAAGSPRP